MLASFTRIVLRSSVMVISTRELDYLEDVNVKVLRLKLVAVLRDDVGVEEVRHAWSSL